MKKLIVFTILCLILTSNSYTQNFEKIKGNRNVVTKETATNSFHTIDLDEDFDIELFYSKTPSVIIEADENLHEVIKFRITDSILTFNKTTRITSKKKLNIKVGYDDALIHISTSNESEIFSSNPLNFSVGTLTTKGNSKAGLTIKCKNFAFEGSEKSKVKLNLTSDYCNMNLSGNSKIEALINATNFTGILYQRANATIEGTSKEMNLELENNTKFDGKNFTINTCNIDCKINSDAYLEVLDSININASGSSAIYLYQNPKISINTFANSAKLQKKVK